MLLMVEKGIRGAICHAVHRYAKANNKCMEDYDKNEESSYLIPPMYPHVFYDNEARQLHLT